MLDLWFQDINKELSNVNDVDPAVLDNPTIEEVYYSPDSETRQKKPGLSFKDLLTDKDVEPFFRTLTEFAG